NPTIRGQAQGFLVLVTYGAGMLIGAQSTGWLFNELVSGNGAGTMEQWQIYWMVPAIFAAVVMAFFAAMFYEKNAATASERGA
ncbi:MAG: MFS transporter, partial [Calditrichaeota bacterium]|nr:MFS transporter [Calditrichota bacterium]